MKKFLFTTVLTGAALTAMAANPFSGTYLMISENDYGTVSRSAVTITDTDEENVVEVTGLINAEDYKGTTLKATTDEAAGTLTFAAGQEGQMWGSPVSLTLFEEADGDYKVAEGPIVARRDGDGAIVFEGLWGFCYPEYDNEIASVITSAKLVIPNANFEYSYLQAYSQMAHGEVPLTLQKEGDKLTVTGFSPINIDPIKDMTFVIDRETKTASLENPETPNASGWVGDRYLCTITSFSGDFQNAQLEFDKGIVCQIENGTTLVFPAQWGIVSINPNEAAAEPYMSGIYYGGRLVCDFYLCEDDTEVNELGMEAVDSEVRYYDFAGRQLSSPSGLCFKVQNGKVTKTVVRAGR